MSSIDLKYNTIYIHDKSSLAFKVPNIKDIWLFNCPEECQNYFIKQKIKIIQISIIIITHLNIENISGLPGLLSSLSLLNREQGLHIYGPTGLEKYLTLEKKYSQTHFRYKLYFHKLTTGLIIKHKKCSIYCFSRNLKFEFIIIINEKYGKFNLNKAKQYQLIIGPLYGQLKQSINFILPDGLIINGTYFTNKHYYNTKIALILDKYNYRQSIEITAKSKKDTRYFN